MALNYNFNIKGGKFEYNCTTYSSYMKIKAKDIKQIYCILNKLDALKEQVEEDEPSYCVCNGFGIIFNFNGCIKIKNYSNWLNTEKEVPIIKRELRKYIKKYNKDSVKDIIIKIKSLKKGSSNIIKEDLK